MQLKSREVSDKEEKGEIKRKIREYCREWIQSKGTIIFRGSCMCFVVVVVVHRELYYINSSEHIAPNSFYHIHLIRSVLFMFLFTDGMHSLHKLNTKLEGINEWCSHVEFGSVPEPDHRE